MVYLLYVIFSFFALNAEILISRDVSINIFDEDLNVKEGVEVSSGTEVFIKETRVSNWYQILNKDKNIKGYVEPRCIGVIGTKLVLDRKCPLRSDPSIGVKPLKEIEKGTAIDEFKIHSEVEHHVLIKGKSTWLSSSLLRYIHKDLDNKSLYEPVPIQRVMSLKQGSAIVSPYIDKTMYVSTPIGVFMSPDARDWYRIKKLERKNYEIAVTEQGWLIADNLFSRDQGRSFGEIFPSYAMPYEDSYVKSLMISPQGKNSIYMTFSTRADSSNLTLFVLHRLEDGWQRVYPVTDGRMITVPVEDTVSSILGFISTKWLSSSQRFKNKKFEIDDIDVSGSGNMRKISMLLNTLGKGQDYQVVLSLEYSLGGGWSVKDETWRFI